MVSGCGTCQQPPHSCLGDRCQQQEGKPALHELWVLVPLLPLDLPTGKGEPDPVHLTSWPNPWILFTSFNSGHADYVVCVCFLLETYRLLGSPGFPGPAAPPRCWQSLSHLMAHW